MAHAEEAAEGRLVMAEEIEQAPDGPSGSNQAGPSNDANARAEAAARFADFLAATTQEDLIKPEKVFKRLDEQVKVAEAMPLSELSEELKAKAQMAVENNWAVDGSIRVLSRQGLEACYRAFLGTLEIPPQMGPVEFGNRMHTFGVSLLSFFWQQEAFKFPDISCHEALDRFPGELDWELGTEEET